MPLDSKRKIKRKEEKATVMLKRERKANQGLNEVDLTLSLERPVAVHRTRRRVPAVETLLDKVHLRVESPLLVQTMTILMNLCKMMVLLKMRTMIRGLAICPVNLP